MIIEDLTRTIKAEKDRRKEFMELYRRFLRADDSEVAGCLEQLREYNVNLVDGVGFYEPEAMKLRAKLQGARQND
jgi:hypothetical protein